MKPEWVESVAAKIPEIRALDLSRFVPPADFEGRESAVLILLGEFGGVPELVVIQRSKRMRKHPGQAAFPGGAIDAGETAVEAALRESAEEIGLDPASVTVLGQLPRLWVPVSGFAVTPVVAWWHSPHPIHVVDPGEVERVERLSLVDLIDPDNRVSIRHSSGFVGPAFLAGDLTIWGFTGALLDRFLDVFGFSNPWDAQTIVDLADREPGQDTHRQAEGRS